MSEIKQMSLIPRKGEIRLFIALHEVDNMSVMEILNLAQGLGFNPELQCRTWEQDGKTKYGVYAMLHEEQREYDSQLETDYETDKAFELLWNALEPNAHLKVHFSYNLKHGRQSEVEAIAA